MLLFYKTFVNIAENCMYLKKKIKLRVDLSVCVSVQYLGFRNDSTIGKQINRCRHRYIK